MEHRIKFLFAFFLLAGMILPPLASSQAKPANIDIREALLDYYINKYNVEIRESANDLQVVASFLMSGKLEEALSVLDKVVARLEQEADAAGLDPESKLGLLKKSLPFAKSVQLTIALFLRGSIHMAIFDADLALPDLDLAISLLPQDFDPEERANFQARLALYQQGKPFREKR